jgi:hypothetical protein
MAGLVPAIHGLSEHGEEKTWMPGTADKFTLSAQSRPLWPGMTVKTFAAAVPSPALAGEG